MSVPESIFKAVLRLRSRGDGRKRRNNRDDRRNDRRKDDWRRLRNGVDDDGRRLRDGVDNNGRRGRSRGRGSR